MKTVAEKPKEVVKFLNKIVEKLKTSVSPYKIVLFGSYAKGKAKPDSDIDLMVILDSNYLSRTNGERNERDRSVEDLLIGVRYRYGMDLKIFSRADYKKLKDKDSFFVWEIERTGETLYEKQN